MSSQHPLEMYKGTEESKLRAQRSQQDGMQDLSPLISRRESRLERHTLSSMSQNRRQVMHLEGLYRCQPLHSDKFHNQGTLRTTHSTNKFKRMKNLHEISPQFASKIHMSGLHPQHSHESRLLVCDSSWTHSLSWTQTICSTDVVIELAVFLAYIRCKDMECS